MSVNLGTLDRTIRVIVGLAILSLTVVGPHSLWGLLGLLPIAVAAVGYFPLYAVLGIRTCPAEKSPANEPAGKPS